MVGGFRAGDGVPPHGRPQGLCAVQPEPPGPRAVTLKVWLMLTNGKKVLLMFFLLCKFRSPARRTRRSPDGPIASPASRVHTGPRRARGCTAQATVRAASLGRCCFSRHRVVFSSVLWPVPRRGPEHRARPRAVGQERRGACEGGQCTGEAVGFVGAADVFPLPSWLWARTVRGRDGCSHPAEAGPSALPSWVAESPDPKCDFQSCPRALCDPGRGLTLSAPQCELWDEVASGARGV